MHSHLPNAHPRLHTALRHPCLAASLAHIRVNSLVHWPQHLPHHPDSRRCRCRHLCNPKALCQGCQGWVCLRACNRRRRHRVGCPCSTRHRDIHRPLRLALLLFQERL
jgi:hypothetical protein